MGIPYRMHRTAELMKEYFYQCPYCWEQVSLLVDVSQAQQNYIEDCEVCCNPIEFHIHCSANEMQYLDARNIEQ